MTVKLKSFHTYFPIFKLTFRQLFWSRRVLLILLGCVLPLVIALIFRFNVRGTSSVNSFIPYLTLIWYGFAANLCAIFYGSAIISDEIDGRGLTFLQMRPIEKSWIILSKFAAYLLGTVILFGISHLLLTGILETHPRLKDRWLVIGMSFCYTGSIALGMLVYGAFAVLLSVRFKNPVLWGLIYVFGWERITTIPGMPIGIKRVSFTHYLTTIFPDFKLRRDLIDNILGDKPPELWIAALVICLVTIVCMWFAIRIFNEREYLM